MSAYTLKDLIDLEFISSFLEKFSLIHKISLAIFDLNGEILISSNWLDICNDFYRANPKSKELCLAKEEKLNDKFICDHIEKSYLCPHGLNIITFPIYINNEYYGKINSGQFLKAQPNLEYFKEKAKIYNYDEEKFLKELEKVPIYSDDMEKLAFELCKGITEIIVETAEKKIKILDFQSKLNKDRNFKELLFDTIYEGIILNEPIYNKYGDIIDYKILEISKNFESPSLTNKNDIIGKKGTEVFNISHDLIKEYWKENKNKKNETIHFDFDLKRWFKVTTSPIIDNKFLTVYNDITEQILQEKKIKENEVLLSAIFNNSSFGFCYSNKDGKFIKVNDRFSKIMGYSEDELLKMNFIDISHPEDMKKNLLLLNKLFLGEIENFTMEKRYIKKNGAIVYCNIHISTERDANNEVKYFIGVVEDITDKIKDRNIIKADATILKNLNEGILLIGYDDLLIKYANRKIEKLLGYEIDELLGLEIHKINAPTDFSQEEIKNNILKEINEKDGWQGEIKNIRKDGTQFWSFATISIFEHYIYGKVYLSTHIDITDRKIAEEKLLDLKDDLERIFELSPDPIGVLEAETLKLVKGNKKLFEILNIHAVDHGKSFYDYNLEIDENLLKNLIIKLNIEGFLNNQEVKYSIANQTYYSLANAVKFYKNDKKYYLFILNDITELKKAQSEIEENYEKFINIFEYSPNAIGIINRHTRNFVDVNNRFCELSGYCKEDVIGRSPIELGFIINEDIHNKLIEALDKFDKFTNAEVDYKVRDGRILNTLISGKTIWINNELHSIIMFNDITEYKKIQNSVQENYEKFISIFNFSPIASAIYDFETRKIIDANPAFEELTEYKKEELIGKTSPELGLIVDNYNRNLLYAKLISDGFIMNEEATYKTRSGRTFESLTSAKILTINNRKVYIVSVLDITDRKKTENKLLESEKRFQQIANITEECIWEVDSSGLYTYINPIIEKTLGYKPEEVIGKMYYYDFFPEAEKEQIKEKVKELFKNKEVITKFVNSNLTKWGELRLFETSGVPLLDSNDNLVGYRGVDMDITERYYENLELIRAKEKAEKSDKLKTSFLQNMSHEIRTPLNGIMGFASLLKDIDDLSNEEIKEYSQLIFSSSQRLLGIVNDVLSMSQIDSGLLKTINTEFSLNEVINYFKKMYSGCISMQKLEFKIKIDRDLYDLVLKTDKDKLYQILTNLFNNALKFTEKGTIEFGAFLKENRLHLYVKDTGIGIDKKYHESIFDRFWQYEAFTDKKYGGTGLGLAITKGLCEILNAEITLESEVGIGSTFTLILSNESVVKNTANKETKNDKLTLANELKVLLAEDDDINFLVLDEFLKIHKIKATRAITGEEAVNIALANEFDIILMDIKMPVFDGVEAIKRILDVKPNSKILVQTAYSEKAEIKRALEAGCTDYLVKPFTKEDLLNKIKTILNL